MALEFHQFFVTTAKAMEPILEGELKLLGLRDVVPGRAGVSFKGTLEDAYRVCLWSRIANRVLLPLKTFSAPNPEKLYGGVKSIRWTDHLDASRTLAVDFSSSQSQITHTQFGALKVKDAVVDQLRSVLGERPSVNVSRPDVRINVYVLKDEATVSIDLSGASLHLRGYREEGANAPLKENLAGSILALAEWSKVAEAGGAFYDPMCGSGTLPIEAALIAARVAPGISREYYGFQGWLGHVPKLWKRLIEEAEALQIRDLKKLPPIIGSDQDPRVVRIAQSNLERTGLRSAVRFERRELSQVEAPATSGVIVVNPPYGERLGEIEELRPLYRSIGDTFKRRFKGWTGFVFTGSPDLAKEVGLKATRRHVLYNGPIECRLLRFELY